MSSPARHQEPVDFQGRVLVRCKLCPALVRFVRMYKTNAKNPLDPEPSPKGNIILSQHNDCLARALKRDEAYDGPRYVSHWATCPGARGRRAAGDAAKARTPSAE